MLLDRMRKALSATPEGLLTLHNGGGIALSSGLTGAFQGSSVFGFPRSSYVDGFFFSTQSASYGVLWQTQPAVRDVVGFMASNFAQVAMELKDQDQQTGRIGAVNWTHPAYQSTRHPNEWQGGREFIEAYAADYLVYDNAYVVMIRPEGADLTTLVRVPAFAVGVRGENRLKPDGYRIMFADGKWEDIPPDAMLHMRGYNALDPRVGWSKLETLRQTLIEESTRRAQNIEFNRGGRMKGGYVKRPLEAPEWSDPARERFEQGWASRMKDALVGKTTPVLEEGMDFVVAGVTPKEAEALASAQFSRAEVAHAYGMHPDVMGIYQDRAVLTEARKQLVEDILPPIMHRMAEVFTMKLAAGVYDDATVVFAFDIQEKQEGKEDLMQKLVGAAGHPIVTPNEARKVAGYEPLDDPEADKLHHMVNVVPDGTPLNAAVQPSNTDSLGKPSTNVMPPASPTGPAQDGSHRTGKPGAAKALTHEIVGGALSDAQGASAAQERRKADYTEQYARLLRRHFARQRESLEKGGSVTAASDRWNRELAADLATAAIATVTRETEILAAAKGRDFDASTMHAGLRQEAEHYARIINKNVQDALVKSILDDSTDATWDRIIGTQSRTIAEAHAAGTQTLAAEVVNTEEETS